MNVAQTTTFVLSATNAGGTSLAIAVVAVAPTIPPIVLGFNATPAVVKVGASSTLAWNVLGGTSLSIDQGVGEVTGLSSVPVVVYGTTTFTLTAKNAGGTVTRTVTVSTQ